MCIRDRLSSALWNFHTIGTQGEEAVIQAPVPGCWENYPDTVSYRGPASYSREFEAKGNIRLEFKGVSHTASVLVLSLIHISLTGNPA